MASSTLTPANVRAGDEKPLAYGAADWLHLVAAPTFAVMAALTVIHGNGMADMICGSTHGAPPLSGMALMYLLMSAFHSAPWLKLVSSRFGLSGARNLRFDPGTRQDNER